MKFSDLRIEFKPMGQTNYILYITDSNALRPPNKVEKEFVLPFIAAHLEHYLDLIRDNVQVNSGKMFSVYKTGTPPSARYLTQEEQDADFALVPRPTHDAIELPCILGSDLFIALFGNVGSDAYNLYDRARRRVTEQESRGLRLRLVLPLGDETLYKIPFEYLYDPYKQEYLARANNPAISIVRAVPPEYKKKNKALSQNPLRLWYIAASPKLQTPIDDFDIISNANMNAGMKVTPIPILKATTGRLINILKTFANNGPHVIHISAHGDSGKVLLQQPNGHAHPVLVEDLSQQLAVAKELFLVIFSVCDIPITCALDLCRRGVSVVAMQAPITAGPDPMPAAASHFQQAFYESYLRDDDLDAAVVEGRKRIAFNINDTMEWGTPVVAIPDVSSGWHDKLLLFFRRPMSVARWIFFLMLIILSFLFAFMVYDKSVPPSPPPAIQKVTIFASTRSYSFPEDGRYFPIDDIIEGSTILIDVIPAPSSQPITITAKILGNAQAKIVEESRTGQKVRFTYTPPPALGVDVLEFCSHEQNNPILETCITIALDMTREESK